MDVDFGSIQGIPWCTGKRGYCSLKCYTKKCYTCWSLNWRFHCKSCCCSSSPKKVSCGDYPHTCNSSSVSVMTLNIFSTMSSYSDELIINYIYFHRSPPLALQPSLGHYFSHVNQKWKKGYEVQTSRSGHYLSHPPLSHVVVVSVSAGHNDYQVSESLNVGISVLCS